MRSALERPTGVSLGDLLPNCQFFGGRPTPITSCCDDSRHCKPGDLFGAMMGPERDGHDHAEEAVRNGAVAVLAERPLPVSVPTCIVEDSRIAFGQVCHALAGNPADALRVVGVSGSYGKTTTSLLIASIIEAAGEDIGILGSLGYCDGRKILTDRETTPGSPELARWLAQSADNGCSHAIVEASCEGLTQHRLSGIGLDAAVLTNVRRAHVDLCGSVLNYRRIKQRLFEHLKPEGFAVINADDPASRFLLSAIQHPVITVGMNAPAEIVAEEIELNSGEQTFLLTAGNETMPVCTRIIGRQHVYNCLSAAAVGLVYGIDLATIVAGLESVRMIPGRMERVGIEQDFAVFVDAAHNADSLAAALKSLRRVTEGRLICVYGMPGERQQSERPLAGRAVENFADMGIITRNNPFNDDPMQIAHDILDGYDRPAQAHLMMDRARAIGWALAQAKPGDTVLIAGRGDEKLETADGVQSVFDDREVVRAFLTEMESWTCRQVA